MSVLDEPRLNAVELGELLEATDPAALLVPPRVLRRIIKRDRKMTNLGLRVPHRKSYVIRREALFALVGADELGLRPDRALPDTLLLFGRPEPEALAAAARGQVLLKYWRLLFHARVHNAVNERFEQEQVTRAAIRARIERIGQMEFDEIRTVLRQEGYLLPPSDDRTVYEEFAAFYLEMCFFAAPLVPGFFPAIEDHDAVERILAEDVDGCSLYTATRPAGAAGPELAANDTAEMEEPGPPARALRAWPGSEKMCLRLLTRADHAAKTGNAVRAAIYRAQAAAVAPPTMAEAVQNRALAEVGRLLDRLQQPLQLNSAEAHAWQGALAALLPQASQGIWPPEARLLYDLQKICINHERPVYAPDLVEWVYSGFRRPLVRPLPDQPLVLTVKHLRLAVKRLAAVRLPDAERHALSTLLHDALHDAAGRLRERFRPILRETLARVGLRPENFPERLGESKLIEELLDRITERGFLNMSHLRDALARNQLKLPDLSGPRELIAGDPLLQANRELAVRAAGVYRRGEIYLRWLQRGSALTFGTRPGRWLTLFGALPFLGALVTIIFVQEMVHITNSLHLVHIPHHLAAVPFAITTGALGIFYLLLLHVPVFRQTVATGLQRTWSAMRGVFLAVLRSPPVRWFLDSKAYQLLLSFLIKPLLPAALAWIIFEWLGIDLGFAGTAVLFVAAGLFVNTRFGHEFEETVIDGVMHNWDYLRSIVPGLLRLIMNIFKTTLEAVDRFIYTVDEWLRFRGGEGRLALAVKTSLSFVWFLVTYVIRLYVNVFLEPTVNPIKHFPIVTVVAKFLVPFWPVLWGIPTHPGILGTVFTFFDPLMQWVMATIIVHSLPGAAGFILWECKENWRLYRANRPATLRSEVIGHHGETMLRLLKPGFHSGTLPKLYTKLRRAERTASRGGGWKSLGRLRESLHHVEDSIRHFAERDLVAFLGASKRWTGGPLKLALVHAASNRIRLEVACPAARGQENVELRFEQQGGWLLAHASRPGWLTELSDAQKSVWKLALAGFYHKAGVDILRATIELWLPPPRPLYSISEEGLIVWPRGGLDAEVIYDFGAEPVMQPRLEDGQEAQGFPRLESEQLFFSRQPLTWKAWVAAWEVNK